MFLKNEMFNILLLFLLISKMHIFYAHFTCFFKSHENVTFDSNELILFH